MYTNFNLTFSRAADSYTHFPSPMQCSTTPLQQQNQLGEYDSFSQPNSEVSYNNGGGCSSGCTSSYMGSPSYDDRLMQRSISSHHHHPFPTLFAELLDMENGPVRRVYSTGDLHQRVNGMQQHYHHQLSDSPLSTESNMIIEEMSRAACPYSPEEKKLRIERYKSKKNQRNYNKKIKYVCRKTLADSRPRIRGRFAKNNNEIVMNPSNQWSHSSNNNVEELEDDEDENWDNFFDSLVPTSNLAHDEEPQHSSSFDVLY